MRQQQKKLKGIKIQGQQTHTTKKVQLQIHTISKENLTSLEARVVENQVQVQSRLTLL